MLWGNMAYCVKWEVGKIGVKLHDTSWSRFEAECQRSKLIYVTISSLIESLTGGTN